jgi:alpha-tubulin suppressor-like RCC1 family protein
MPINISMLTTNLRNAISNLTDATKEDILLLSHAVNEVTSDRIVSVPTENDLPDLQTTGIGNGTILYVESIQVLVISCNKKWIGLDSRLLRYDGPGPFDIYGWGRNTFGALGNNSTTNTSSPVTIVGGIIDWVKISAGSNFSMGLTDSGVLYGWGTNSNGQLGNGTTGSRSSPTAVIAVSANWTHVSTGTTHTLGIAGGVAYAWGYGGNGRLGTNSTFSQSIPTSIVGGITNWTAISGGQSASLGIANGIAYAWGRNLEGVLGDNSTIDRSSPVTIVGGISNWSQLSGYNRHSLGIANGIAYAWGRGYRGELGNNSTTSRSSPVTVVGGISNWSQVSAGDEFSIGIANGIAYAWGWNSNGRLGDGTGTGRSSPVTVVGGISNWSQVSAGRQHTLGLTSSGVVYAWGYGYNGQLGTNNTINTSSPVTVVGGVTNWNAVSAGRYHSLGIA